MRAWALSLALSPFGVEGIEEPRGPLPLTLSHWSAASLAEAFQLEREAAADLLVRMGS